MTVVASQRDLKIGEMVIVGWNQNQRFGTGEALRIHGSTKRANYDQATMGYIWTVVETSIGNQVLRTEDGILIDLNRSFCFVYDVKIAETKCECGTFKTSGAKQGPQHSSWCPWYSKTY